MKRLFNKYFITWAIAFAVFNAICFIVPNDAIEGYSKFGGAFWAGLILIDAAFIGQLVCAKAAFKAENSTKLFYNLPLITVSYAGLIVSLVVGVLAMAIPDLPNWIGIVVALVVLALTAMAVVKASAASDLIEEKDREIKNRTVFIKSLKADAESLLAKAATPEARQVVKTVYETIRFSDPMSCDGVGELESQITLKFAEFEKAVLTGEDTKNVANELQILLSDRNSKVKLMK